MVTVADGDGDGAAGVEFLQPAPEVCLLLSPPASVASLL
jgi:hypothetical protein